jgi:uncharacterized protein (TIGR03435 family)
MRRSLDVVAALVVLSGAALAQPSAGTPAFSSVDIRVRAQPASASPSMTGGVLRFGRYDLRNATMLDLITTAYGFEADSVIGGPRWLESRRFDIAATAPEGTSSDALKRMLQTMLADQFKLALHKDTKPLPAFVLTTGGTRHTMRQAATGEFPGCRVVPQSPAPGTVPSVVYVCQNITMESFAARLRAMAGNGYLPNPVVDRTDLEGSWDFELHWTPRGVVAQPGSDGVTVFSAIEKQMGLKLVPQSVPSPVLVVDSVSEQPAATAADLKKNPLPTIPTQFEVASIKRSPPDATPQSYRVLPGGRFTMDNATLKQVITFAWDLDDDSLIAGGPTWLDSTRYTINADASTAGSREAMRVDMEDVRLMLRTLLEHSLRLETHVEQRPVSAYTLVVDKPKLQPALTSDRTRCKEGVAADGRDPRAANDRSSRVFNCQNVTMAEFAERLSSLAPGYLTGSEGGDGGDCCQGGEGGEGEELSLPSQLSPPSLLSPLLPAVSVEEVEDLRDDLRLRPGIGVHPAGHRQPRGVDASGLGVIDHRLARVEYHRRIHVAMDDEHRYRLQRLVGKLAVVEWRGAGRNCRPPFRMARRVGPHGAATG